MPDKTILKVSGRDSHIAQVNFPEIPDGSDIRPGHMPEGEYVGKIVKATAGKSGRGNPQWVIIISPEARPSNRYGYYIGLDGKQAWKIKQLMVAMGLTIPKSAKTIDVRKFVGRKVGMVLEDDEFREGRVSSTIGTLIPFSEVHEVSAGKSSKNDDEDDWEEDEGKGKESGDDGSMKLPDDEEEDELDLDDL